MDRHLREPNITMLEGLKYASPFNFRVRHLELDLFIRKTLAVAPVRPTMFMSVVTLSLAYAFYFTTLHEAGRWAVVWLVTQNAKFALNVLVYLRLRSKIARNEHTLNSTMGLLAVPQLGAAVLWGLMPFLVIDLGSLEAALCFTTACVIVYGNSSSTVGLTWLNATFAVLAAIPTLVYAYTRSEIFPTIAVAAFCYIVGTLGGGHTIAMAVIAQGLRTYQADKQSELISNFLDEYQLNSSDWVWETDADGRISSISTNIRPQGWGPGPRRMDFVDLFRPDDPNTHALDRYIAEGQNFHQLVVRFKPGLSDHDDRTWELRGQPVFDDDTYIGYRGFGRDITSIQELNDLNNSKEKFDLTSKFVAKIAHDFNNSLMVVQSSAEILDLTEGDNLSEQGKDVIGTMREVVRSASRVNKELLSFARQEVLTPTSVDLSTLLEELKKKYKLRAPEVEFDVVPFVPVMVHSDRYALERTLDNLLVNSVEAIDGPGKITISVRSIDVGSGREVAIRVEDNGPGFSREALKRGTDAFFTTKQQMGGSGLGLATAIGFAQQSEGTLTLGNRAANHRAVGNMAIGKAWPGAVVELRLRAATTEQESTETAPMADQDLSDKCILVVDDDVNVLASLGRQLDGVVDEVALAETIDQAVAMVEARDRKFDIVLSDFKFEGDERHGGDLAELIRTRVHHIILMTAYNELAESLEGPPVLPKPFSLQEFKGAYQALATEVAPKPEADGAR